MKNSYLLLLIFLFCGSSLWGQTAEEWYKKGKDAYEKNNYEQAIIYFTKATGKKYTSLNYVYVYTYLGLSKRKLGRYEEAIKDYDKAITLDKGYAIAYNNRGNAKYDLRHFQAAKADYEKALSLNPNYTTAKDNLKMANEKLQAESSSNTTSKPQIWSVAVGIDQYQ
ncbi:MAG: tetratricopeptide repeat protein, partial [Bacteroidota bacterium]